MSVVSGVVLCMASGERLGDDDEPPAILRRINAWLAERGSYFELILCEDHFGGSKHPQMLVAGGGFNYFDGDEFVDFILSIPWEYPENVVLVMKHEEWPARVFRPEGHARDDMADRIRAAWKRGYEQCEFDMRRPKMRGIEFALPRPEDCKVIPGDRKIGPPVITKIVGAGPSSAATDALPEDSDPNTGEEFAMTGTEIQPPIPDLDRIVAAALVELERQHEGRGSSDRYVDADDPRNCLLNGHFDIVALVEAVVKAAR